MHVEAPRDLSGVAARPVTGPGSGAVPDGAPDVELVDVTKRFGGVVAVDRMSLAIARGSFTSFLGPSGCGKTTTLRMIAGFEQPTTGEIYLAGQPIAGVPPYRRNVNTVFQHYALFPHMSVEQNIGYGLRQRRVRREDERQRVTDALRLVRLEGFGTRRTWQLSGGQQQRVALARALINEPTVLLLDEPLGALDRQLRHEMQLELKALQQKVGITFVYVTHDQEEALTMSDLIVVMRDGRIQQQGTPESLYERPVNRFVASFVGTTNFIDARLVETGPADSAFIELASGLRVRATAPSPDTLPAHGSAVTLALRPEAFVLSIPAAGDGPGNGTVSIAGRVQQGTYLGDQTEYRVATDELGEILVRRQNDTSRAEVRQFGPGESVAVRWREEASLVLGG